MGSGPEADDAKLSDCGFSLETPAGGEVQPEVPLSQSQPAEAYAELLEQQADADADGGAPAQARPASPGDRCSESDLGGADEDKMIEIDGALLEQQADADGGAPAQEDPASPGDRCSESDSGGADEDKMIEVDWQQMHANDAGADVHGGPVAHVPNEANAVPESTWASSLAHSSQRAARRTLWIFWHALF